MQLFVSKLMKEGKTKLFIMLLNVFILLYTVHYTVVSVCMCVYLAANHVKNKLNRLG